MKSSSDTLFDRLVRTVLTLIFATLILRWAVGSLHLFLVSLWAEAIGSSLGGLLGRLFLSVVVLLLLLGVLVRIGHGLSGFWRHTRERLHGPSVRAQRTRGAEHVPASSSGRRSRRDLDPPLHLGGGR